MDKLGDLNFSIVKMAQDASKGCNYAVTELTGSEGEYDINNDKQDTDRNYNFKDNTVNDMIESNQLKKYNILINHLNENQYDYDAYVRLCDYTIEMGDLDCLNKAFKKFADVYPLTPKIWLKYFNIRIPLSKIKTERMEICKIFKTALRDYYAVDLAVKCADYISIPENIEVGNNLWLDLDTVYGLDYEHGHDIFNKKRRFICNNNKLTCLEKVEKTLQVYRQEMSYPLKYMEETYISFKNYKEKEKEIIAGLNNPISLDNIVHAYEEAKKLRIQLKKYEELLFDVKEPSKENPGQEQNTTNIDNKNRDKIYIEYLACLKNLCSENNFDMVILHQLRQVAFERLVSEFFMIADYWLMYTEYVDRRSKTRYKIQLPNADLYEQTSVAIATRALRNCNSKDLYIKAMQLKEQNECTENDIRELLEQSLCVGFTTPEPEVEIYLEYLTYLIRCTDYTIDEQCVKLRKNFDWAWNYLGRRWGALADPNCEILQLWGKVEYEFLKNPKSGRELWTTVMASSDNGSKSALWIIFAQMEAQYNVEEASNLYSKALKQTEIDDTHLIASSWKLFERTHGSIESRCACYFTSKLLIQRHIEKKSQYAEYRTEQINTTTVATEHCHSQLKRKIPQTKNIDVMIASKKTKFSKVQFNQNSKVLSVDLRNESTQQIEPHTEKDSLRVFLSNIDYQINEDDIRVELSQYMKINNIELKRSHKGKSRGFGFMELVNPAEVQKALQFDRHPINGRPIYISLIHREPNHRKKFEYTVGKEPKKLFIKNLPIDCTKEELEKMLSVFGKLNEVRLVYHKSGIFKQIAFAEFDHESDAGNAVLGTNNMMLRSTKIAVALSNPPMRFKTENIMKASPNSFDTTSKKPRMTLIPRIVSQKLNAKINNALDDNPPSSSTPQMKTNNDFRKLLIRK